jgi:hypothetical protein
MKRALLSLLLLVAVVSLSSQTPRPSAPESRERGDLRAVMARALVDYRDAKYEQAQASLMAQLASAPDQGEAELRLNASLCALRLLHSRDAEELVAPLVDDQAWAAEAAFVLGLASNQHAERAVVAARLADAEPMAWVMATRAIRGAELHFRRVVASRPNWGEAVRNLERVVRRRAEIEAERAAAKTPDAKKESAPEPEPPTPPEDKDPTEEVVIPEVAAAQLSAKELAELQQRVREQQDKKRLGRQQRSRHSAVAGERDW